MTFTVIIPVCYHSSQIPGKPLVELGGKPMIQHVYERARESGADDIIIAADDERIKETAESFGAEVCMTSAHHASGTERISEVANIMEFEDDEIIINVQGNEPLVPPSVIHHVATDITGHDVIKMCTVVKPITDSKQLFDPNIVKVAINRRGFVLYFGRAPIPWEREHFSDLSQAVKPVGEHYAHVGIYGFRAGFLREYIAWEPCEMEKLEGLEQLRVLWHGGRVHALVTQDVIPPGVRTQADVDYMRKHHFNNENAP